MRLGMLYLTLCCCSASWACTPRSAATVAPGCYQLEHGPWSAGWGRPSWTDTALANFLPPRAFALDTAVVRISSAPGGGGGARSAPTTWRAVRALDSSSRWQREAEPRLSGWRVRAGDTLQLQWSTGYEGARLFLVPAGPDTLVGYAEPISDAVVPHIPRASARAVRRPCG